MREGASAATELWAGFLARGLLVVCCLLAGLGDAALAQNATVPLYGEKTPGVRFPGAPGPLEPAEAPARPAAPSPPEAPGAAPRLIIPKIVLPEEAQPRELLALIPGLLEKIPGQILDRRERVPDADIPQLPFGALVHIRSQYLSGAPDGVASGFLVDPGLVVTAAHVLHDKLKGVVARVIVTPACAVDPKRVPRDKSVQIVERARFRIPPGWRAPEFSGEADYAGVILNDRRAFAPCGVFDLRPVSDRQLSESIANKVTRFILAGFPAEKDYGSLWLGRGALRSFDRGIIRHLIDTTEGQSGSPLMGIIADPASRRNIAVPFAIHSGGDFVTRAFNTARRIDKTVLADIDRWKAEVDRIAR